MIELGFEFFVNDAHVWEGQSGVSSFCEDGDGLSLINFLKGILRPPIFLHISSQQPCHFLLSFRAASCGKEGRLTNQHLWSDAAECFCRGRIRSDCVPYADNSISFRSDCSHQRVISSFRPALKWDFWDKAPHALAVTFSSEARRPAMVRPCP